MMNKMYLFIIASIILGLIISYYYNNKFDKIFVSMFIMITIIFFILFYFLGNKANIEYEKFSNQSHRSHKLMSNISNEHFNLQQLHSVLNEIDTEADDAISNKSVPAVYGVEVNRKDFACMVGAG